MATDVPTAIDAMTPEERAIFIHMLAAAALARAWNQDSTQRAGPETATPGDEPGVMGGGDVETQSVLRQTDDRDFVIEDLSAPIAIPTRRRA
jgi:hypothetical protein